MLFNMDITSQSAIYGEYLDIFNKAVSYANLFMTKDIQLLCLNQQEHAESYYTALSYLRANVAIEENTVKAKKEREWFTHQNYDLVFKKYLKVTK